jgi:hypothetical protein
MRFGWHASLEDLVAHTRGDGDPDEEAAIGRAALAAYRIWDATPWSDRFEPAFMIRMIFEGTQQARPEVDEDHLVQEAGKTAARLTRMFDAAFFS